MRALLVACGILAATAGVPWLHGADGTHAHHAAAVDACSHRGPCHGHGARHDDDHAGDHGHARDEGHHHDDRDDHGRGPDDGSREDGPSEHDGSCVTCVDLHLLTCTPPAADADRVPTHSFAAWIQEAATRSMTPASRRMLPPSRGPPFGRVS